MRDKIEIKIVGNAVENSIKVIHGFIGKVPVISFIWKDKHAMILNYKGNDVLWGLDETEETYKLMEKRMEIQWKHVEKWIPQEIKNEMQL